MPPALQRSACLLARRRGDEPTCSARTRPSDGRGGARFSRECSVELVAGADVELREDFVEVVLDGARADEHPRADLRIREPVAREPRDLGLLGSEVLSRLD